MNPFSNTRLFSVKELFPLLINGKGNNNILSDGDSTPYLGAKKDENGVMRYCAKDSALTMKGNCICFICNGAGSVGYTLYMDRPFIATSDIVAGYNDNLNPYIAMYLISLFDLERPRFSYGRKWKKTLKDTTIPLPQTDSGNVDWVAIDSYIKNSIMPILPSRAKTIWSLGVDKTPITQNSLKLSDRDWKWFRYDEVFKICKGFYNKKPDHNPNGDIPFIGATDANNGVTSLTDIETIMISTKTGDLPNSPLEDKLFKPNCITVSNNGSVGYAFYQSKAFTCSHDVNPLYLLDRDMNKYIGMFLCSIIELDRYRWNYGRKWRPIRMPSSMIKLPVNSSGKPDWQFMEEYIKRLPFSNQI